MFMYIYMMWGEYYMILKYSQDKIQKLISKFIHYNHYQELGSFDEMNLEYIPQEFRFFAIQNRPIAALNFYVFNYGLMLNEVDGKEVNKVLLNILESLSKENQEELRRKLIEYNTFDSLAKKSKATYQIDLDRSKGNRVTQSLLHIFASAYENTECLYILNWMSMGLNNKPMKINFNNYKDSYGNVTKGRLINNLIRSIKNYPEFREIVKIAYNKKLRNLCAHNAAMLNDQSRMIIGIDDPTIQISYEEAFQSFYSLQQLHNYVRMFANLILIDDEEVKNEGIFSAITIGNKDGTKELALLQLFPFFHFDQQADAKLRRVTIKADDNSYNIFSSDKNLFNTKKNEILKSWIENDVPKKIAIYSAYPDIYEESDMEELGKFSTQFGEFICNFEYQVEVEYKIR